MFIAVKTFALMSVKFNVVLLSTTKRNMWAAEMSIHSTVAPRPSVTAPQGVPDQAPHYHTLGPKLGAKSLARSSGGSAPASRNTGTFGQKLTS
jgi:hypothetical protein